MATIPNSGFTSSDAQTAFKQKEEILNQGIVQNDFIRVLKGAGCLATHKDLSVSSAQRVTIYSGNRLSTPGVRGDADFYSQATFAQSSGRDVEIAKVTAPMKARLLGSQDQQYAAFRLTDQDQQNLADWTSAIVTASLVNQATGNTATSISVPSAYDGVFTGGTLLNVTGNNAAIAPTYWYEANLGGAITTAAAIDSSNTLTIKDFQLAAANIGTQVAGRPTWQTCTNGFDGVALISQTGFNQMINEAVTVGQGLQMSRLIESMIAGGKQVGNLRTYELPGIPFKFVVCNDSWLPRGVSSGAEQANTRRAVILGKAAVDLVLGRGYSGKEGTLAGVNIEIDSNYKTLNKERFATGSIMMGARKATATGTGSSASTSFDLATYVIDHYSAT